MALFQRDLRLSVRVGGSALVGVLFFLAVVTVIPFGVGPDLNLLARIGPAILWIGALLAQWLLARWHDAQLRRLAALEGTEAAIGTASGMAAILMLCMGLLKAGDHVVGAFWLKQVLAFALADAPAREDDSRG